MSTDKELGRIVKNHCRSRTGLRTAPRSSFLKRSAVIAFLIAVVCAWQADASTITSASVTHSSEDDTQQELLASFGIGQGSAVESLQLSVNTVQGLEAYADYFPLSIFSGYLNTWITPSSPEQILLSNLLTSNNIVVREDGGSQNLQENAKILSQLLRDSRSDDDGLLSVSSNALQGGGSGQSQILTTQSTTTVSAPEPGTLVLFGCATVALSLALANRTSRGLSGDPADLADATETKWPTETT